MVPLHTIAISTLIRKSMNKIAVIIVLLLVLIAGVFIFYPRSKVELPRSVHIDTTNQPTIGNATAPVQMVAFEDLKCFNCMRYETTLFSKIKQKYIDTGKARYTFINLAFIPGSMPAANAAQCVYAQNKELFFPFVEYIFSHQPPEEQDWATIPNLIELASHVPGVNKEKFSECLIASPYVDSINNNLNQAIKIMGGEVATPSLFINGRPVEPLTLERVDAMVKAMGQNNINSENT